jgi:protoporphyrinogen oxidase
MPETKPVKFLLIGAGPTGLGAAYRLRELGEENYLVLDAAAQVGGLAASFRDENGFVWDIGGHVQFSHYRYFDELMQKALGPEGWLHHQRESWVWIRDRFVPYPFQNNIRHLPPAERWECIQGLVRLYKNPPSGAPANFREWIRATFGTGLAKVFMEPYNFKVWAYPPEEMDFNWIGERVAVTDLERVLKNLLEETDDLSWGPNNTFQFPREGGTGAIWEGVANLAGRERIRLRSPVARVDAEAKTCELANGEVFRYEYLLSTIPLDRLAQMTSGISAGARSTAAQLKYSSSNIVGIGVEGQPPEVLRTKCWMYFPEDNCPFYRVTVLSNYSPNIVPQPGEQWSLMAEVSESAKKTVDRERLIESVEAGLRATKLLPEGARVLSRWKYSADHGYPTPFLGRDSVLRSLHAELEPKQIYSRGRFGGWKYEVSNQDHSLMQGVEWVNRMLLGVPETTYPFPATANANWGR